MSKMLVLLLGLILTAVAPQAMAGDKHGAIAYSESTSKCGYSYDFSSRGQAERQAVNYCGVSDCEVVVWFMNNCGALAEGKGMIGYAYGPNKAAAQEAALEKCGENATGCKIICWACNTH